MNPVLTSQLRALILKKDLIDTGLLYSSAIVETQFQGWRLVINIKAPDYLKYHIEDLIDEYLSDPLVNNEIENLYTPFIEKLVFDTMDLKDNYIENLEIDVRINGN